MNPCEQKDTIIELKNSVTDIRKLVNDLRVSDGKRETQMLNLVVSMDNLIGWIKIFVGTSITIITAMLAFLIQYWVKG